MLRHDLRALWLILAVVVLMALLGSILGARDNKKDDEEEGNPIDGAPNVVQ